MACIHTTFSLDKATLDKLDWVMKNSAQPSRSGFIMFLIEREYVRLKKLKLEGVDA